MILAPRNTLVDGPDWAVQLTAWATLATAIILGVTAIVIGLQLRGAKEQLRDTKEQLRDAEKTRTGELLTDLSRRWDEDLIVRSELLYVKYRVAGIVALVEKLYKEGGETEQERSDFLTLSAIPNLAETLGVMEAEGSLSLRVIDRMWGATIREAWDSWRVPIDRLRELKPGAGPSYVYFEKLALKLRS